MSLKRFLTILQGLLTLIESEDEMTVHCLKSTLENIYALAKQSSKCDCMTVEMISMSIINVRVLVQYRKDFISVKGDPKGSAARRDQLRLVLRPSC